MENKIAKFLLITSIFFILLLSINSVSAAFATITYVDNYKLKPPTEPTETLLDSLPSTQLGRVEVPTESEVIDYANDGRYEKAEYPIVEIKDWFGWIGTKETIELIHHDEGIIFNRDKIKVTLSDNLQNPLSELKLIDVNGKEIERNQKLEEAYIESYDTVVNDYIPNCSEVFNEQNKTTNEQCNQIIAGNHTETNEREVIIPYNPLKVYAAGEYYFYISATKNPNEKIDWQVTSLGQTATALAWWDATWSKKQAITVNGSVVPNFTLSFYIPKQSSMNATYSDLRFVNSAENAELPYWIEESNTSSAKVWVKVQDNNTIYAYYGNTAAVTTSNFNGAFLFADDFNDASLNTSKWNRYDQSGTTCNVAETGGRLSLGSASGANRCFEYTSAFSGGTNYTIKYNMTFTAPSEQFYQGFWDPSAFSIDPLSHGWAGTQARTGGSIGYNFATCSDNAGTCTTTTLAAGDFTGTNIFEQIHKENSTGYSRLNKNGVSLGEFTKLATITSQMFIFGGNNDQTEYLDWIFIRPNVAIEPNTIIGAEQGNSGLFVINSLPQNGITISNTRNVTFACNITGSSGTNLTKITLVVNGTATWNQSITGLNTPAYNATFYNSTIANGNYTWYCAGVGTNANSTSISWTFTELISAPIITFDKMVPAALTSLNLVGVNLNISYNATNTNLTYFKQYFKTNNSLSDVSYYENGTAKMGYQIDSDAATTINTTSITYLTSLDDNTVYPASYPLPNQETNIEGVIHSKTNFINANSAIKLTVYNMSNTSTYNLFEIMINKTTNTGTPASFYYCNSTYTAGTPNSNINCYNFNNLAPTTTFNHVESPYSSHQVLSFVILNGKIGTVLVTKPKGYFVITADNTWSYYNVSTNAFAGQGQTSSNGGGSYTANISGTVDAHFHYYDNGVTWYEYACANNTIDASLSTCSTPQAHPITTSGINPTIPIVLTPTFGNYNGNINITWLSSQTPLGNPLSTYNISLFNLDFSFNKTIINVSNSTLNYTWSTLSTLDGRYLLGIQSKDNNSLYSAFDYSDNFTIDNTAPQIRIVYPLNQNYSSYVAMINYTISGANNCWYNNGSTNTTITCGNNITLGNAEGLFNYTVYSNDTTGNLNSSSVKFIVNLTKVYLNSPANNSITYVSPTQFSGSAYSINNITNVSFWTNATGSMQPEAITINVAGINSYTDNQTNTGSNSNDYGLVFTPILNMQFGYAIKPAVSTRTSCALKLQSDGSTIETGTFIGNNCTINATLTAGVGYRIVSTGSGVIGESLGNTFFPQTANNTVINGSWRGDISSIVYDRLTGIIGISVGINSFSNFYFNKVITKPTLWTFSVTDNSGAITFANENRTVSPDVIPPTINIFYPTGTMTGLTNGQSIDLNFSASDPVLNNCFREYNSVNTSINCNVNTSFVYVSGVNTIKVWANDSFGNINYSTSSWNPSITINSESYNTSTYETAIESFGINANGMMDATLNYNGVTYIANVSGNLATTAIQMPLSTNGGVNRTLFWILNSGSYNSSILYQYQSPINFTLCNYSSNNNVTYMNISFIDEISLNPISQSLIMNPNYYLTNSFSASLLSKQFYYNNAVDNPSYQFCFNPADRNVTLSNMTLSYYSNGAISYPLRIAPFNSLSLSNNTYQVVLYGLSSADGRYVQFTITDKTGQVLSGVNVIVKTTINNVFQQIADLTTDTSGQTASIWVNPTAAHTLIISKSGCTGLTTSLYPVSSIYTYQLDCGNSGVPLVTPYIGPDAGLQFRANPNSGPVSAGNISFQLRVMSTSSNMKRIKLELWDPNGPLLYSQIETVSNYSNSTCQALDCYTAFTYDTSVGNYAKLKGRYYVDLGSGWFTLENDAYWTQYITSHQNTTNNMGNFWRDARGAFDSWSSDNSSYDAINRAEFSRIFFLFLMMTLLLAAFNKMTGYDSANPGAFLLLITAIFLLGSMAGGASPTYFGCPTGETYNYATHLCSGGGTSVSHVGFFYLYGLTPIEFLNNYIIAIYMIFITITYVLNVNRRSS